MLICLGNIKDPTFAVFKSSTIIWHPSWDYVRVPVPPPPGPTLLVDSMFEASSMLWLYPKGTVLFRGPWGSVMEQWPEPEVWCFLPPSCMWQLHPGPPASDAWP